MKQTAVALAFGNTIPEPLVLERGNPPEWLLSSYESLEWKVTDIGHQRRRTIYWDLPLGPYGRLPDYPNLLETTKRIIYGLRTGPKATLKSGAQQYNCAQAFFCLIRWMLGRGCSKFADLTRRDIEEYKAACPGGVDKLLNAQPRLQQLVEEMVLGAGFEEGEPKEARIAKSIAVIPFRACGKQIRLNRDVVLEMAGLNSRSETLSPILDALEQDCGFYIDTAQKRRLKRSLQAQTPAEAELDDDDEEEEGARPPGPLDKVSKDRAKMLLLPLSYLYAHKRFLHDTLGFHPFGHLELRKVMRTLGLKNVGRTATAPTKQTITFIERSARWVLNYSRPLLALKKWAEMHQHEKSWNLRKLVRARSPRLEGPASPFPVIHVGGDYFEEPTMDMQSCAVALRKGMSLRTALNFLLAACVVVIAAFTARRAAEIRGLEVGCISKDKSGKPWLRVFIHKTVQDYTLIPVPALVVKAIEVLTRLSATARQKTGTKYLLQICIPGSGEVTGVNSKGEPVTKLTTLIKRFGYFVDVPATEDGTRWAFAPHQFRRFFAVMYIWAYDYGDIDALSYHLRHWNREQTRRYCTEQQVGREVTSANRERAAEVLSAAALGELKFDGQPRLARAVERMCHRMARKVQVVTRAQLEARARRLLQRTNVSLHAFPWGYCVSTEDGQECPSNCNREGSAPRPEKASIATCSGCHKAMRGHTHRVYLRGALKMHQAYSQDKAAAPKMREASAAMVEVLEELGVEAE